MSHRHARIQKKWLFCILRTWSIQFHSIRLLGLFLFSCKVLYLKFYLAILPLGFFSGIYSERFFFLFLVPLCCFNVSLPYNTTDSTRLLNKLTLVWMRNFDELKIFPSLPNCDIAFPSPFMFKFPSPSLCPHQLLLLLLVCILVR